MATLTVVGRSSVSTPPDEASLVLTVESVRPAAGEALSDVAERARTLVALLDELGVGAAARTTTGVSVGEAGEHRDGVWQHRGYRANERLTVTVGEAATVARVLADAVERAGAAVEGPWWSVSAAHPARADALRAAAGDARVRAEALAAGLGMRLGALVEAVETDAQRPVPRGALLRAMARRPHRGGRGRGHGRPFGHVPGRRRVTVALEIDRDRLVDWARRAVGTPSFTGSEQAMAELMRDTFADMGLRVQWQQVEDGRANVLGIRGGTGGGSSLMFNGHMDTSYSGREPWLAGVPGFQPSGFVDGDSVYGLGISNMKGALACYVEALRALGDAGIRLRGDVMIAAVCGEIEKTQWGDAQGAEYRGYAAGSRHLVSHGGVADMCILGEPTESKIVLGHFGSLWLRISTAGNFIHTAFSEGQRGLNSILRMRDVLDAVVEWIPSWEDDPENAYGGEKAIVNVGAVQGGFGWRVSRTPHRTDLFLDVRVPPTKPMAVARAQVLEMVRGLADRFPDYGIEGEVYVTAPGAEIDEGHPVVAAVDEAHTEVFGSPPERAVTRWFSDASVLSRYGIATVNYGTSTGLMDTEKGENLSIDGLVRTAEVYARAAMTVCGIA